MAQASTPQPRKGHDPAAEILPVIVGTAGHVDHGKTELVKHLTGIQTDRLKEEQQRRLSIDLGFAPYRLRSTGQVVGIIDVPGHEDFIRNMIAGAAAVDVLLLVVAANDSVMPQTREHMQLVRLLRTPKTVVALTKTDLVDNEWLALAREEVAEFMTSMGYPDAPILKVSNATGTGIDRLAEELDRLVLQSVPTPDPRAFRMPITRVFTLKGHGTIATGVPLSGQIGLGETVELLPGGKRTVVRDIQTYHKSNRHASAHISCALNLRDLAAEELRRGMTLALPGVYTPTRSVIATVSNISELRPFKSPATLRFHAGTAAVTAKVRILGYTILAPKCSGFVHIRLDEPLPLAAGDPYILRLSSPSETLAGGRILSAYVPPKARISPSLLPSLESAQSALDQGRFTEAELYATPAAVFPQNRLKAFTQQPPAEASATVDALVQSNFLTALGPTSFAVTSRLPELRDKAVKILQRYHREHPYTWGMKPTQLAAQLRIPQPDESRLTPLLTQDPQITLKHGYLAHAEFTPPISQKQMQQLQAIEGYLHDRALTPPAYGDLIKQLAIPERDLKTLTRLLLEEKKVVQLGKHLMLTEIYDRCRHQLLTLFEKHHVVDLHRFRETTGLNRNVAVALLESFDQQGLTRRTDEGRILVPSSGEAAPGLS